MVLNLPYCKYTYLYLYRLATTLGLLGDDPEKVRQADYIKETKFRTLCPIAPKNIIAFFGDLSLSHRLP